MKIFKKYYLFIIFILIILIEYLGIFQSSKVRVDDISFIKPFGYKYSSVSSMDDNSTFSIFKNAMGLRTKNELHPNHFLRLEFKQSFLNKSTRIVLFKLSNKDIKFLKNISTKKCTHQKMIKNNSEYKFDNIIYTSRYKIYIVSNNKEDLMHFYNQICN
jgi:hypothetical protein